MRKASTLDPGKAEEVDLSRPVVALVRLFNNSYSLVPLSYRPLYQTFELYIASEGGCCDQETAHQVTDRSPLLLLRLVTRLTVPLALAILLPKCVLKGAHEVMWIPIGHCE